MQRYLNMFMIIGIGLLLLGLLGAATGGRLIAETGTKPNAQIPLVYLGTGVLMIINSYISVHNQKSVLSQSKPEGKKTVTEDTSAQ